MNKIMIIGNVSNVPEQRATPTGKLVCNFNVAVNRRKKVEGQPDADFFRVSAWGDLGDNCMKYLTKGKKVCVVGSVGVHVYTNQRGEAAANMEVLANEVEFLSPREQIDPPQPVQEEERKDEQSGLQVVDTDELPF